MKPSKSLKTFKNKKNSKDFKNEMVGSVTTKGANTILPALTNLKETELGSKLNDNDIRLFSIYGMPN